MEPSARSKTRTPPRLVVVADEPRIRQVLTNLLGNVREHTAPDTAVAVRLSEAGQGALLEVTEAGQGMDAEAAARAFDRFYRGGTTARMSRQRPRAAIVQAIAGARRPCHAQVGGRVRTSVQFWIPFARQPEEAERSSRRERTKSDKPLMIC